MTARLALPLALLLAPAAAQQQQGDAATDKASLLLFAANSSTETSSWLATAEPCGAGWASTLAGWRGVQCDDEGGRVSRLDFSGDCVDLAGDVGALAPLGALSRLLLGGCASVHGNRVTPSVACDALPAFASALAFPTLGHSAAHCF